MAYPTGYLRSTGEGKLFCAGDSPDFYRARFGHAPREERAENLGVIVRNIALPRKAVVCSYWC